MNLPEGVRTMVRVFWFLLCVVKTSVCFGRLIVLWLFVLLVFAIAWPVRLGGLWRGASARTSPAPQPPHLFGALFCSAARA